MNYPVRSTGFERQRLEVQDTSFFSGVKLLVNGAQAPAGTRRGEMVLLRDDGSASVATWKPEFAGLDLPKLVIDGQVVKYAEPLKWYQWIWSLLPIALIAVGGAVGGALGFLAVSVNFKTFRSSHSELLKYMISAVTSVLAVGLYVLIAGLLHNAFQR